MRTLKLQVQTTLDGYMAGPNGEMDWLRFPWSDDVGAYVIDSLMAGVDQIVLGRKLAEGFIPAWESRPEGEPDEAIDWMINTPKVVFSNTLSESPWANTTVVGGELGTAISALKAQPGGDLIVYGGGSLVAGLVSAGLVDELHLFLNPNAIGNGMPVFGTPKQMLGFEMVDARRFDCGITVLHLTPRAA